MCVPEKRALSKERERFRKNIDPPPCERVFAHQKITHEEKEKRREGKEKRSANERELDAHARSLAERTYTANLYSYNTTM